MRRLNKQQATIRYERIARRVEKLRTKHEQKDFTPNITPMTSFYMDVDTVFMTKKA